MLYRAETFTEAVALIASMVATRPYVYTLYGKSPLKEDNLATKDIITAHPSLLGGSNVGHDPIT